jgi:hypothetical protein
MALALPLLLVAARPQAAHARPETLMRSVENITQGPLDMALAPGVAGYTAYRSITAPEATTGERMGLALVAGPWAAIIDGGAGLFRFWAGLAELPVGLALLVTKNFTDAEPGAFFDTKGEKALVDHPGDIYNVKFGTFYVSNPNVP